jgi:hypothetical protein
MTDPAVFREHLDTIFMVDDSAGSVPLRLVEVSDEPFLRGIRQFSLFFHGPADRVLSQRSHAFRHPALGTLEVFVVPVVGSNSERIVYQACFSVQAQPADGNVVS